jgi:type II secretory pathway pseudopilin PulG
MLSTSHRLPTAARSSRAGFTLIELLIYSALTAIVVGIFVGILLLITNINSRQTSSSQLTTEVGFLMSNMRRLVHQATSFSIPDSQTLELTMNTVPVTTNTIVFNEVTKTIELIEDGPGGAHTSTLSAESIQIDDLTFTNRSNGLSKSVSISLTATVFPDNAVRTLSKTIETTAALYVLEP